MQMLNRLPNRIYFYPDYSGGNPYQKLIYSDVVSKGVNVKALDISDVLEKHPVDCTGVVFHLHWLNYIFKDIQTNEKAWELVSSYMAWFQNFIELGGKILWTVHNHLPHESLFFEQDFRLRCFISTFAEKIHLHCPSHIAELKHLPILIDKVVISRHPNYIDAYGTFDIKTRIESLYSKCFKKKVLFLGMIREYKSIDTLLSVTRLISESGISVTIAGQPQTPEIKSQITESFKNLDVRLILRRVSEKEIHDLCCEHNIGVLSYRKILTSGTLQLFKSYGMTIFSSNLDTIRHDDPMNSILYYEFDDLLGLVERINKLTPNNMEELSTFNYFCALQNNFGDRVFRF